MANHKSALKRIRRNAHRAEINRAQRSRVRGSIRKVREAIDSGDQVAARAALQAAQPAIQRGGQNGILHRNTASRTVSRLNARIRAMGEAKA